MPAASSRWASSGEGEETASVHRRSVTLKRPQRSGSSISTEASTDSPEVLTRGSGRANGTPRLAARSRATPATERASGRFGFTSRSKSTSSDNPSAEERSSPSVKPSGRIRMPDWSVPMPNSAGEQSIPSEGSPRILRRPIRIPPGSVEPTRARGTRSPTAMLKAPQQTWTTFPSACSTSTEPIRSAEGWGRRAATRATTMPSRSAPKAAISSTVRPRSERS